VLWKRTINSIIYIDLYSKQFFFCHFYTSRQLEDVDTLIDFLISASEETRRHVDACIREALACAVKTENEQMVTRYVGQTKRKGFPNWAWAKNCHPKHKELSMCMYVNLIKHRVSYLMSGKPLMCTTYRYPGRVGLYKSLCMESEVKDSIQTTLFPFYGQHLKLISFWVFQKGQKQRA